MAGAHEKLQTGARELVGIVLLTAGLLMALALVSYQWKDISLLRAPPNSPPANYIGPAGAWFAFSALMTFGAAALLLPVGVALIGALLVFRPAQPVRLRALWWLIAVISIGSLVQLYPGRFHALCEAFNIAPIPGGLAGWLAAEKLLRSVLGTAGAVILLSGVLAGSLFMFIGRDYFRALVRSALVAFAAARERIELAREAKRDRMERIAREEKELARQKELLEKAVKKEQRLARLAAVTPADGAGGDSRRKRSNPLIPDEMQAATERKPTPPTLTKQANKSDAVAKSRDAGAESRSPRKDGQPAYVLPPIDLLQPVSSYKDRKIQGDFQTTARILKETLAEFGIESDVTNIEQGPVVTRYELLPAPGIRVEKIAQLSNNLALTLKATSVRVQAPIPGKGVVGIEVPNAIASKVYLREILEGETWRTSNAAIPLILGKDVAGNDLVADLASMPHLLIAGSTGSGKTVCINTILTGLLMSQTPDQMRLMLVDPKIVEFAPYNHLPHLVVPVITDPKKVPFGLRWAILEMGRRYKLFARAGVRTIQSYNSKQKTSLAQPDCEDEPFPEHIPYIVIVIDELADLMSTSQADIENYIARLAQLSRAVGIHMILATQRPSVNVITGTIKANFPARISFQVAQKVDSRTILDTGGADKLLGRGDMLILPPGSSKLVRAQGAMTTDEDVHAIVNFIKERSTPNYEVAVKETIEKGASDEDNADETEDEGADADLLNTAIGIIRESHRASVSLLQRRMKIGYNRAGRLMDVLEDRGIVGPAHGSDPREILIDLNNGTPAEMNEEPEGEEKA